MTTPRICALVSPGVMMAVTLVLGACAGATARTSLEAPASYREAEGRAPAIRFDNDASEHVHVYLVGDRREWLLGRVEPGAVRTLRLPDAALGSRSAFFRLAVIAGEHVTPQAARDPRAMFTIAQPASAIVSQQWKLAHGQLVPLIVRPAR